MRSRPSKGDSGYSKAILGAILIYAAFRYLLPFAALGPLPVVMQPATAQDIIPSRIIKVVEFDDRGRVYRVDIGSGVVTYTESGDVKPIPPKPKPEPPKPVPPPKPELSETAIFVGTWFVENTAPGDRAEIAAELIHCLEVTLAKAGGLGLKGQEIIDDLAKGIAATPGLRAKIKGFPLGRVLELLVGKDETKLPYALREAKAGLEAIR